MKKISLDIQKFASPASVAAEETYWKLGINLTDTPGTSSENTSNLIANFYLQYIKSGGSAKGTPNISYIISGEDMLTRSGNIGNKTITALAVGGLFSLGSIRINQIPHNNDGTKTIHIHAEMLAASQTTLTPAMTGNIIIDQNIELEKIYRYSTLLSVENFDEDSSYTALNYISYPGSGSTDTLSVKYSTIPELILDDTKWGNGQINLTEHSGLQPQSVISYLSSYIAGKDNVQATFTLISTIGDKSLTTTAIAYMNKKYVFSQYKVTTDKNFIYQKTYYTYNSTSNKYEELSGYAVFSTATTTGSFQEGKRYFERYSDDTGTWYVLLKEGTDYQIGETITTHYPNGVYLEDQSIATYKEEHHKITIYDRDDNYNICQHIVHNKAEKRYRMAINGVVDPAGPPLQVYTAYNSDEATSKEDLFFYRPGDRVSITGYTTGALISNTNATIRWTVVLPKRLDFVKAPKIVDSSKNSTTCMMYVRCSLPDNGYVHASGDAGGFRGNASGTSWTDVNIVKYPSSGPCNKIKLEFIRKGKWKMWANNTPGAGSTVTNNQPLVAEVSNLLLEFPTE